MSDFQRQVFDDAAIDGVRQHFGDHAAVGYARELWRLRRIPGPGRLGRLASWLMIGAALMVGVTEASLRLPDAMRIYSEYTRGDNHSEPATGPNRLAAGKSDPIAVLTSGARRESVYPWILSRHDEVQIDRPTRVK